MYIFDDKRKTIHYTAGGYQNGGLAIRDHFVRIGMGMSCMRCVLYEPELPEEKSKIGIVVIHSDDDYSTFPIGGELARRGYRTLCGQVRDPGATLEERMRDILHVVQFLKEYPGIEKVVLMGHSGGATLMSAYQSAAENGTGIYQGSNMLSPCTLDEELIPADGLMTLDSNWGNGSMTLFSIDPSVVEENGRIRIDPELDPFQEKNGYAPDGSHYSEAFLKKFLEAQAERNNRIIHQALDRLTVLNAGKGFYAEDEPFVVPAAAQFGPCNKLFPEDVSLLAHTKEPYILLHKDGGETREIVRSVRRPRGGSSVSRFCRFAFIGTVRSYLSNRSVLAGEDYTIRDDGAYGIRWENTFNCTPGNIRNVSVPLLAMGMTGSYEGLAAEEIFHNAGSTDKSIAFVEGAGHNFDNMGRDEFGDTQKLTFDYADRWLSAPGRFLN